MNTKRRNYFYLNVESNPDKKHQGSWLFIYRLIWVVVVLISVILYIYALPLYFNEMSTLSNPSFGFTDGWTVQAVRNALAEIGTSSYDWAVVNIIMFTIFASISLLVGCLVFWRKSDDPMSLFTSLWLILFGLFFNRIPTSLESKLQEPWLTLAAIFALMPVIVFFLMGYLFPNGRFVPSWTRWLVPVFVAVNIFATFFPGSVFDLNNFPVFIQLPIYLALFFSFIYAPIFRYRQVSTEFERQQIKWVVRGLVIALVTFFISGMAGKIFPSLNQQNSMALIYDMVATGLVMIAMCMIPLSFGYAVLRSNLWDIEPLVNRTLVYIGLTISVVLIYTAVVWYFSAYFQIWQNSWSSLIAAGIIAVVIQPLREQLQRLVNRLMYGERDDPYNVVARLGHRLEENLAPDKVLPTIVKTISEELKIPLASLWLVENEILRLGAVHGGIFEKTSIADVGAIQTLNRMIESQEGIAFDLDSPFGDYLEKSGISLVLPVIYRGECVGILCLAARSQGEAFAPADLSLLRDLAGGAGAAVQAAQLALTLQERLAELRQSHERLLTAQEEERQRIQRDLHDGLGPVLASMRLRLEACLEQAYECAPDLVGELTVVHDLIGTAASDIRHLVYDLRPPVLDQLGLAGALRQRAERFGRETGIDLDWSFENDRVYTAVEEIAIFRIVHEGLLNIQKHSKASEVKLRLSEEGNTVLLTLMDNGMGFDTSVNGTEKGAGIRSMRERADLISGSFRIESQIGKGTQIEVRIPSKK